MHGYDFHSMSTIVILLMMMMMITVIWCIWVVIQYLCIHTKRRWFFGFFYAVLCNTMTLWYYGAYQKIIIIWYHWVLYVIFGLTPSGIPKEGGLGVRTLPSMAQVISLLGYSLAYDVILSHKSPLIHILWKPPPPIKCS